jgi:hypothetical protein
LASRTHIPPDFVLTSVAYQQFAATGGVDIADDLWDETLKALKKLNHRKYTSRFSRMLNTVTLLSPPRRGIRGCRSLRSVPTDSQCKVGIGCLAPEQVREVKKASLKSAFVKNKITSTDLEVRS